MGKLKPFILHVTARLNPNKTLLPRFSHACQAYPLQLSLATNIILHILEQCLCTQKNFKTVSCQVFIGFYLNLVLISRFYRLGVKFFINFFVTNFYPHFILLLLLFFQLNKQWSWKGKSFLKSLQLVRFVRSILTQNK